MNTKTIVDLIQQKFCDALQSKTGWGRNELITLHSNIIIEVLALAVDDMPVVDNIDISQLSNVKSEAPPVQLHHQPTKEEEMEEAGFDTDMYTEFWGKDEIAAKNFDDARGDV